MAKVKKQQDIKAIIQQAVTAGIEEGRKQAEKAPHDAYKATERRLYALPVLLKKIEETKERLSDLEQHGLSAHSKDVIRFSRSGTRLEPSDIQEFMIADLKSSIAADEHEVEIVQRALKNIEGDAYYLTVVGRYFKSLSDEDIAKQIPCDTTTVWRQRKRLVRIVAVWLYGAQAV